MANTAALYRAMNKDPQKFKDRVELGDNALKSDDFEGAVIEYSAALKLKEHPGIHRKLGEAYSHLKQPEKSKGEYDAATKSQSCEEHLLGH